MRTKGDPQDEIQLEAAIDFLASALRESRKNPKPVLLHSIRVGLQLYDLGYKVELAIAGILHDVLEDTEVGIEQLQSCFGPEVANLVQALTFDETITDKTKRYQENFQRSADVGKSALIIRAADFYDNMDYYHLAPSREMEIWLHSKLEYFLQFAKGELENEVIFRDLRDKILAKMQ